MINYDKRVDPAAPFLQITVANRIHHRKHVTLPALLDTGSDFTAIPSNLVNILQIYPTGRINIEDVKLQTIPVFIYTVRLTVADLIVPEIKVIVTEIEHAIIGRDLLNRFYLHLHGPEQQFALSTTP